MFRAIVLLMAVYYNRITFIEGVPGTNLTSPKDMYVVRATVYQVGILTNGTKDSDINKTGRQESITFYHHNGSEINLSDLPSPLVTNITAENVVGLAPVKNTTLPWSAFNNMRMPSKLAICWVKCVLGSAKNAMVQRERRNTISIPANITKASLLIPAAVGVQSISLPPLLSLNNNISRIPVPIPNVSVVSYTKASTVVRKPEGL